ncbi:hypothetical protein [Methylobacterium sp. Leaf118]|uniref:hypothetical protein n=1 Tax=Methylobacterium sp. Leaf118 TaxID=2876562 RepID=UPI001E5022D3|nr:hypothetical protein [Methylobacterium sp. Leaf118]
MSSADSRLPVTGLIDEEWAPEHPLWFEERDDTRAHLPEAYGIAAFVDRLHRPFDPGRLQAVVNTPGRIGAG